nr:MAG TPA: hypothetical protein [Herelleviridae sp.]
MKTGVAIRPTLSASRDIHTGAGVAREGQITTFRLLTTFYK